MYDQAQDKRHANLKFIQISRTTSDYSKRMATESNGEPGREVHHYEDVNEVPQEISKYWVLFNLLWMNVLIWYADTGINDIEYGPNMMRESG